MPDCQIRTELVVCSVSDWMQLQRSIIFLRIHRVELVRVRVCVLNKRTWQPSKIGEG